MAANANGEYKVFKYYEGLCSSGNFPKEIAKVLALGVKSDAVKDIDGNTIKDPFVLKSKNWDIVYPAPDTSISYQSGDETVTVTFQVDANGVPITDGITTEEYMQKILNQVNKITDTVVLKTTTTPKDLGDDSIDDLTVDATSNSSKLSMYLEIYKPTYIANPEEYPLDCERQGITPKLITKELYEESMKTTRSKEENIYKDTKIQRVEELNQTTSPTVTMDYTECDKYLKKICKVLNDDGAISIPQSGSTSKVIDASYLARIKQEDSELYLFILNSLNDGEGIEPKDYTKLETVTIEVYKTVDGDGNDKYDVQLLGVTRLVTYTIPSGYFYDVSKVPSGNLIPELYLDGIYTPLESKYYHTADKRITFDKPEGEETFSFEQSADGVLVIRYNYESTVNSVIADRETMLNNHYVLMRLFDNINTEKSGPADNIYNSSGEITQTNSHISPWSKLSWYQDFEEVMIDSIDADVSTSSIQDGTVFVPLETVGLNADTKMRYWINTNNDRFSIVVMGNPSLDYERDRHLVSACYCGRIDSFENSINDTAGNFALFTCASTEPCNTTLTVNKNVHEMKNYVIDNISDYDTYKNTLAKIIDPKIGEAVYHMDCENGRIVYDIPLGDKKYFDRTRTPKYIIVEKSTGHAVTPLLTARDKFWVTNDGKTDTCEYSIHDENSHYNENYTLYIYASYYEETYTITSGVARDVFGNVIDVDKVKDYGSNTSDGVTSIMMYHTRSKAYYQKHHMMFATTEEYMSKVMYGKSSYTGEYYADRIKVTHGNDGPRGTLSDLLVIDSSSLYALDELVINKDFEKDPDEYEETFVYFPITAPYSPLSDSPNSRYGLAIKKAEIEPKYEDEAKVLKIAVNELQTIADNAWIPVESDITPLATTSNGCNVYWKVLDDTAVTYSNNADTVGKKSNYVPVKLVVINSSEYSGDIDNPIVASNTGVSLNKGSKVGDLTNSYLAISGFEPSVGEKVYYGISDKEITEFGGQKKDAEGNPIAASAAQLKAILFDQAEDDKEDDKNGGWEYGIEGVPYTAEIGQTIPVGDITIEDASPAKFLMLYSAKQETVEGKTRVTISKFACLPLVNENANKNDLLQYPCTVNVLTTGGDGFIADNYGNEGHYINSVVTYGSSLTLTFTPDVEKGYSSVKSVYVNDELQSTTGNTFSLAEVKQDSQIKVIFA